MDPQTIPDFFLTLSDGKSYDGLNLKKKGGGKVFMKPHNRLSIDNRGVY